MPGALGEQGETVGLDVAVADTANVGQRAAWRAVPDIGLRAVIGEGLIVEIRAEVVRADHVIEELALGRGEAKFLRVLFIFDRNPGVVSRGDVETVVVGRVKFQKRYELIEVRVKSLGSVQLASTDVPP